MAEVAKHNSICAKKDRAPNRARCLHGRRLDQAPDGFSTILKRLSSSLARVKSGWTIKA
jgi:hypothetical protein